MSITFNEAALVHLLEAPDGPYGDRLRLVAETITDNYNAAIGGVWENQPAHVKPQAAFDISLGEFGLQAEVGIVDTGSFRSSGRPSASEYMANKFENVEPDKFVPKIMADWDSEL